MLPISEGWMAFLTTRSFRLHRHELLVFYPKIYNIQVPASRGRRETMREKIFLDETSDILRIRHDRRSFLGNLITGAAGAAFSSLTSVRLSRAEPADTGWSTVSLVTGKDRRDMVYQSLKPLAKEIENRGCHAHGKEHVPGSALG